MSTFPQLLLRTFKKNVCKMLEYCFHRRHTFYSFAARRLWMRGGCLTAMSSETLNASCLLLAPPFEHSITNLLLRHSAHREHVQSVPHKIYLLFLFRSRCVLKCSQINLFGSCRVPVHTHTPTHIWHYSRMQWICLCSALIKSLAAYFRLINFCPHLCTHEK